MTQFFILEIDNNLTYEDNYVEKRYFETYGDAYYTAECELWNERGNVYTSSECNSGYCPYNDYRIIKVTINGIGNNIEELLSVWTAGNWYHGDDIFKVYGYAFNDPRGYTTFELMDKYSSDYSINMTRSRAMDISVEHNIKHLQEIDGYNEFCHRTGINYWENEYVYNIFLLKFANLKQEDEEKVLNRAVFANSMVTKITLKNKLV